MNPSEKKLTGYRTHFARLKNIRSDVSAIRTHKFKCAIPKKGEKELKEKFGKLAEVVDSSKRGSGFWFLLNLINMGFLFPSAGNKLLSYQEKFGEDFDFGFPVPNQVALSKRLQTGSDSILNIEKSCLEIWKVEKSENLPEVAKKILNRIEKERNGKAFGGRKTGLNLWVKKIFAEELQCEELETITKGEDYMIFNIKFLEWNEIEISEWITQNDIPELSLGDDSYPWLFKNILPSSSLLGEKPIELINPYHIFAKFLDEWKTNTDELQKILEEQIPRSFLQKEKFISLILKKVHEYSKEVVSAKENDFIAESWAEYRETNFSGRLQGWISNFEERLKKIHDALADSIHPKELENWKVPKEIGDFLLEKREDGNFVFKKDLPKEFEKQNFCVVDEKTGEIKAEQELQEFYFWGKGKDKKGELKIRRNAIFHCTKNILQTIEQNCDFENIFPQDFQANFEKLKNLQTPLLEKLRDTIGITNDQSQDKRDIGQMIAEYGVFWQAINEFLAKWENEGVPKMIKNEGEENEIQIWDNISKKIEPKAEKYWFAKSLLADKKDKNEEENEAELERDIVGKFKKSLLPSELPKYPRFLYEAAKNPTEEIEKAAEKLPKIVQGSEKFVQAVEKQKDKNWENQNWLVTQKEQRKVHSEEKEWQTVWHFGQLHKSLEALKKIAMRAKNPQKIIAFLDSFVEKNEQFEENAKSILGQKKGFDATKEMQKLKDGLNEWKDFYKKYIEKNENTNFSSAQKKEWKKQKEENWKKFEDFHFYLSGKEYGFAKYKTVPIKMVSMEEFIQKFEEHFKLEKNGDFIPFLDMQNGGATDNSATQAELLKFWWAKRMHGLEDTVTIPDFSHDPIFRNNVLKSILFTKQGENEIPKSVISRFEAQKFLTAGLGSDLRAKIGLLSRKSFIQRNVVQITNGGQTLLQYIPKEWDAGKEMEEKMQKDAEEILELLRDKKISGAKRKALVKRRRAIWDTEKNCAKTPFYKLSRVKNHLEELVKNPHKENVENIKKRLLDKKENLEKTVANLQRQNFSLETQKILEKFELHEKTNEEIVAEIWKKDVNEKKELAKILGEIPHSWKIILKTKQEIGGLEKIHTGFFIEKSEGTSVFNFSTKKSDCLYAFDLQTSVVQKQFLEKFLWGDSDEFLTETIIGPTVILETEKLVQWKNGELVKAENGFLPDGEMNMFVAIPFDFSKEKNRSKNISEESINFDEVQEKRMIGDSGIEIVKGEKKESQKQYRTEKNLLGIDLGEYGFGFAVFDPKNKKFETSGFIEIPQLKKMRDDAADWKDTQSSGIFSRPTTHLAKIREHAAGAVRNAIHALALQYDAIPVYEDSVDGFEQGGQRISKLYKTIKTSDVIGGSSNEADAGVRKHFWGDKFANIGVVIGAAKTSQTCRKCGRCATSEIEEYAKNIEEKEGVQIGLFSEEKKSVAWKNGKEIFFEILDGKIVGTDITCNLPNGEQTKSDVWNTVKKAQRKESEEERKNRENGKRKRGTVEKFECQICKNITDCDAQAAQNIALKYFFKITATQEEQESFTDEKGNFSTLKHFLEKSKTFIL